MFEGIDTSTAAGLVTAFVLGLAGVATGLRKWYVAWISDRTDIVNSTASQTVVSLLNDQIKFLGESNREFSEEIHKLRVLNTQLSQESSDLKHQMYILQHENATLKIEITELRVQVDRLTQLLKGPG